MSQAKADAYANYLCAKAMQAALQKVGLYGGVIDGKWGPKSREAYDEFNRRV